MGCINIRILRSSPRPGFVQCLSALSDSRRQILRSSDLTASCIQSVRAHRGLRMMHMRNMNA
jgi:hypothetical protein